MLLADSDARRRRGTATILRLGGYRVSEVASLGELREAVANGPDALVSMADLHDGDVVAYLNGMRGDAHGRPSRIAILCEDAARTAVVAAALGSPPALQLPVRPSALLAAVGGERGS